MLTDKHLWQRPVHRSASLHLTAGPESPRNLACEASLSPDLAVLHIDQLVDLLAQHNAAPEGLNAQKNSMPASHRILLYTALISLVTSSHSTNQ